MCSWPRLRSCSMTDNMHSVAPENDLGQRARWLIRLRWLAAVSVACATFGCARILGISLQEPALYGIALLLLAYNAVLLVLLNRLVRVPHAQGRLRIKKLIHIQISADLVILTGLLHFSGGVENPFAFFFVFHMIIASILLSFWESCLQATLAVLLFGALVLLEHHNLIPHYCLGGFVRHCQYQEGQYVLGTFLVLGITLYLAVYMASYIAVRLRRAERAQMQANEQLREKDRIKDEYVARLTHDIKGHLAAIQSCLAVAITGSLSGQTADFVGRAHRRTQKLTAFVRMLLKLTRMRLNGKLDMAVVSLSDLVHNAYETVEEAARDKSISLYCDLEASAPAVLVDRAFIEETIVNLLRNAVKYTPAHGTISIDTRAEGSSAVLDISDTGIGIPEAERSRIFDEFYRASNAREAAPEGTGLGLSLAKHVVELHGGSISVLSTGGAGATFRVVLPRVAARRAAEPVPAAKPHHVGVE